jgi:hypothetical protein
MSYSYIKSVFPNFESSNIANYNNSGLTLKSCEVSQQPQAAVDDAAMKGFAKSLIVESYNNTGGAGAFLEDTVKPVESTDNLRFYGIPSVTGAQTSSIPRKGKTEGFENDKTDAPEACEKYINHVMSCGKCMSILRKQLQIESDRVRNEEVMELVSYIIFGLFILLMIDNLKK